MNKHRVVFTDEEFVDQSFGWRTLSIIIENHFC
jgi:hypothetical protein